MSKRTGQPGGVRDTNRKEKERVLLDAALLLFLARGVEGVSVDDITRSANVAKGSFYRYFKDQEALVETLVAPTRRVLMTAFDEVAAALSSAVDRESQFSVYRKVGAALATLIMEHPGVVRLYLQESRAPAVGARRPLVKLATDINRIAIVLAVRPDQGEPLRVEVWNSVCEAIPPSPAADRWLSDVLGRACRLAYMPDSTRRLSNPRHAGADRLVGFADGYAYLVASEASLEALNARLARPVGMERFRPNLVVSGVEAFAEDGWGEFAAGGARLRMAKPCGRCVVTTTDQATGTVTGPEPLATLAAWRPSAEFGPRFGMNAVSVREGVVRVGDAIAPAG